MNSTLTPKRKLHGENTDFGFRLPRRDLEALEHLAVVRGWSVAEALRRAVRLFLRENMDITNVYVSPEGHTDE